MITLNMKYFKRECVAALCNTFAFSPNTDIKNERQFTDILKVYFLVNGIKNIGKDINNVSPVKYDRAVKIVEKYYKSK